MLLKVSSLCECLTALLALVWAFAEMYSAHMLLESTRHRKRLATLIALVGAFAEVHHADMLM